MYMSLQRGLYPIITAIAMSLDKSEEVTLIWNY